MIKRIDRQLVHKGSILDIYEDTMDIGNGKIEKWDYVAHRKGAAAVAAVLDDGSMIMVRQLRPVLERMTLEIPAGSRDSVTEDTAICATRELEEETGYRAGKLEKLLSLRTTVAFCDEFIDVYLATDLEKIGEQHLDDAEEISIETYPVDELVDMVEKGIIQDSKTVSAILAVKLKMLKGEI